MTVKELKELLDNVSDDMEINVTPYKNNNGYVIRIAEKKTESKTDKTMGAKVFPDYYKEVVSLKSKGFSNKYIAEKYDISVNCVSVICKSVARHKKLMRTDELYKMLDGNTRAYRILRRSGVSTINDLINHINNGTDFSKEARNCGIECQMYIEKCLKKYLGEEE